MSVEGGQIQKILEEMSTSEKKALKEFSKLAAEKKYKAGENHPMDTVTFVRFLVANKFNIKKATSQLEETLQFREETNPFKITPKECPIAIRQGTWRFCGFSKTGACVIKILAECWRPGEYTVDEHQNVFLYYMEQALHQTKDNYQFICLFDMHDWSLQHTSMRMIYRMASLLQKYYPERLFKAFLVNTPFLFNATWKAIKGVLDARTVSKVQFLSEDEAKDVLLQYIPKETLEKKYGGEHEPYKSYAELHPEKSQDSKSTSKN